MRRSAVIFALAFALAISTQSCSYLLGDPYGNYLQKVDAWVDLRSGLQTALGLTLDRVNGIEVAEGSYLGATYRHVLVKCDFTNNISRIRSLAYGDLSLSSFDDNPSFPGVFSASRTLDGDIRVGGNLYRADLAVGTGTVPSSSTSIWSWFESPTYNDLVYSDMTNLLHLDGYNNAWASPVTLSQSISSTGSWQLARASLLADGRVCLLFFMGMGGQGTIRAASFPDAAAFRAAFSNPTIMEYAASLSDSISVNSTNGSSDNPAGISAWLTADGVVSLTDQGNNRFTFQRYPLGPGSAIDEYVLSANYDSLIYFEASGNYWYRFDRGTGRLFRLRTWWK
jgi:hypothetical protein